MAAIPVTVLVVDDDQDDLRKYSSLLTRWGFAVISAQSSLEAQEAVWSNATICLVLIAHSQEIDGIELTRELKAMKVNLVILLHTIGPYLPLRPLRSAAVAVGVRRVLPKGDLLWLREELNLARALLE